MIHLGQEFRSLSDRGRIEPCRRAATCLTGLLCPATRLELSAKKGDMLKPNDDLPRIAPASFQAVNVPA